MTFAFPARTLLFAIPLGLGLSVEPAALHAQTFDSTAGTAPSQKLSTPPDAAPVNQPGAMRQAYSHRPKPPAQPKTTRPAPH